MQAATHREVPCEHHHVWLAAHQLLQRGAGVGGLACGASGARAAARRGAERGRDSGASGAPASGRQVPGSSAGHWAGYCQGGGRCVCAACLRMEAPPSDWACPRSWQPSQALPLPRQPTQVSHQPQPDRELLAKRGEVELLAPALVFVACGHTAHTPGEGSGQALAGWARGRTPAATSCARCCCRRHCALLLSLLPRWPHHLALPCTPPLHPLHTPSTSPPHYPSRSPTT